ncbi:peptidoglycan recognition protein family protein [Streptomyces physcomitrii]|uniref:Peptidoglycan recognition protein n=1 Tax=Streptomyces physcomitrii TaxID=2724184 RepID=A0ABX1HDM7_9ACTN|nr:peptidoglycan recognition protein [Streptomyces physcomitrii]NKI45345.1 peptidoglycan recognition protein [Streptomyces physcomitrii]
MRGFLASSIGVSCAAAALAAPLVLTASASASPAVPAPPAAAPKAAPGATQSLPLVPLGSDRGLSRVPGEQGLAKREVKPFSLLGVVWDDPDAELPGLVQVRTRDAATGRWSAWQGVETHNHEHAADPGSAERGTGRRLRGGTAPLWVGASDGVEVRVRPGGEAPADEPFADENGQPVLPGGLHLELVDPGGSPGGTGARDAAEKAASRANSPLAPLGATRLPARSAAEVRAEQGAKALPYAAAQPEIVTRRGWGADESIREAEFLYTDTVKAAFVHHSASGNNYSCADAPAMIRSIYRYHVESEGWRDIGYNFLVDKCGKVYEGRAGGVAKPVMGAHTLGFNENSTGVAVLGTFTDTEPPAPAVEALKKLTAWKLGLTGADPAGTTHLVSGGGNRYPKGQNVPMKVISGHRDGFTTECPGTKLYDKLPGIRTGAAALQQREPGEETEPGTGSGAGTTPGEPAASAEPAPAGPAR